MFPSRTNTVREASILFILLIYPIAFTNAPCQARLDDDTIGTGSSASTDRTVIDDARAIGGQIVDVVSTFAAPAISFKVSLELLLATELATGDAHVRLKQELAAIQDPTRASVALNKGIEEAESQILAGCPGCKISPITVICSFETPVPAKPSTESKTPPKNRLTDQVILRRSDTRNAHQFLMKRFGISTVSDLSPAGTRNDPPSAGANVPDDDHVINIVTVFKTVACTTSDPKLEDLTQVKELSQEVFRQNPIRATVWMTYMTTPGDALLSDADVNTGVVMTKIAFVYSGDRWVFQSLGTRHEDTSRSTDE